MLSVNGPYDVLWILKFVLISFQDIAIILALVCAGFECLICIISSIVSCRMARAAKKELFRQQSELFHVQVFGSKDVEIVMTKPKKNERKSISKKQESVSEPTPLW